VLAELPFSALRAVEQELAVVEDLDEGLPRREVRLLVADMVQLP
jgi:hypothetical protein